MWTVFFFIQFVTILLLVYVLFLAAKHAKSCPTLCYPMDHKPPDSSVYGTSQARLLEWVAIPSPRGSSRTRDRTCTSYFSCTGRQIKPLVPPSSLTRDQTSTPTLEGEVDHWTAGKGSCTFSFVSGAEAKRSEGKDSFTGAESAFAQFHYIPRRIQGPVVGRWPGLLGRGSRSKKNANALARF